LKSKGETITPEDEKKLLDSITAKYNEQLSPYYAAARLWVDGIIDPMETRKTISMGIKMANHAPITKAYNVGVIRT
jgi:3-methylcrotonyl-CoA carboxylase beta subunit